MENERLREIHELLPDNDNAQITEGDVREAFTKTFEEVTTTKTAIEDKKLDKPISTGTTAQAPYIVGVNDANESFKLPAGDLGKNLGNSDIRVPSGAVRTLDVTGAKLQIRGKSNANNDASFNRRAVENMQGEQRYMDADVMAKKDLIKAPTLLNDSEKERWRTEMNGGWRTGSMSVILINPMVIKHKDEWQFVSLIGAGLNFNPNNFKIEVCTADSTATNVNVVTVLDNSKVQLISGTTLGFWINVVASNIQPGDYKLRLSNGTATYLTGLFFKVLEASQIKPLVFTHSKPVLLQSGSSSLQEVHSAKDVTLSPDPNIKAIKAANHKDIVAQFQTDKVLKGNENWHFELQVSTVNIENGSVISSYFGLSSTASDSIINTVDYEFKIGKTQYQGHLFTNGMGVSIADINPILKFLKHQNSLIIILMNRAQTQTQIISRTINTDTDYCLVFSKNNCRSVNEKTNFFITNEYKF